jgi:hypothetical protein
MARSGYRWNGALAVVAATAALGLAAGPAAATSGSPVVVKEPLATSGVDANAHGRARLILQTDADGRFEVVVKALTPDTTFAVVVNDVQVGTLTTTGGGNGKARFRTRVRGHDQLLGFDPRGQRVVVRDAAGEDVLTGTIPDDSVDPTEVACCLPDGEEAGEVECEDRTPDDCTAAGGTVATAATCLPNPCEAAPPGGSDIVCCLPENDGAECEDRTQDQCTQEGGMVVMGTSCDPNPCAPTPPVNEVQCCVPEDSGFECEDRTQTECGAEGGTDMGAGTCSPDPCATLPPPPTADIRCCLPNNECEDRTADECMAAGGTNAGPGTCSPNPCGTGSTSDDGGGSSGPH